jgi:putative ABC transport system ATP-binding protein
MEPADNIIISTENLWKIYQLGKQEVNALREATFNISQGEFVAIMGPSGSGKSTLMNILGCLDTPTKGEYYLRGKLVSTLDDNELAYIRNNEIGFVFQVFNLLARATAFHKGAKKKVREEKTRKALEMVEMSDRMNHRPSELSGGERQRVAIARALVNEPSLVLADEPTGNLDSKTGLEIINLFRKIHSQGNTIIVVTHEREIAEHAHRIIFLKDGKIIKEERKGE